MFITGSRLWRLPYQPCSMLITMGQSGFERRCDRYAARLASRRYTPLHLSTPEKANKKRIGASNFAPSVRHFGSQNLRISLSRTPQNQFLGIFVSYSTLPALGVRPSARARAVARAHAPVLHQTEAKPVSAFGTHRAAPRALPPSSGYVCSFYRLRLLFLRYRFPEEKASRKTAERKKS